MTTAQPTLGTYITVYLLLMAGLAATVAVAFVDLGHGANFLLAMAVAFGKATLVVLFFMHIKYSSHLTWLAVSAGLIWLAILLTLTMCDYQTRRWLPTRAPAGLALPADADSFQPPREAAAKSKSAGHADAE